MAEFYNNCAVKYHQQADIDVVKIHRKLKAGNDIETDAICEGCS